MLDIQSSVYPYDMLVDLSGILCNFSMLLFILERSYLSCDISLCYISNVGIDNCEMGRNECTLLMQ